MKSIVLFLCLVASVTLALPNKSTINAINGNHKVYLVFSNSDTDSFKISQLEHEVGVIFWDVFHRNDKSTRIMVAPGKQNDFEAHLTKENIKFEMIIDDVDSMVRTQKLENDLARARHTGRVIDQEIGDIYDHFWNLTEVNDFVTSVAEEYPLFVKRFSVGKTYDDLDIWALQISVEGAGEITNERPIIIVDATIHAREWIATMQAIHLIYQLTVNKDENADLLDDLDWIIIPVVNPDGFKFTHAVADVQHRFWRKTRSPNAGAPDLPECTGTDPNRNFDVKWSTEGGSSDDPCSNTFRGASAASEIEIKGMQDILTKYDTVKLYLTIHSYGKYLLYPFGHEYGARIANWYEHEKHGKEARYAIYAVHGTYYELGNSAEVLYKTTGSSSDYSADKGKTVLTYVAELPGGGTGGFDIEKERIESVLTETFPGIKALAEVVQNEYPVLPPVPAP